jgi:hypothetical protein
MLVGDAPVAVDLAQAHGQPKQETLLVRWVAGRVGTAAHDRDREGDVLARGHRELLDIEGRPGLVIAEEQVVPGPSIRTRRSPCIAGAAASRTSPCPARDEREWRDIVPADRVRPGFEKGFDPGLFGVGVFRHGFGSFVHPEDEPRGMNPTQARVRATLTRERRGTARRTASVGRVGDKARRPETASRPI